jgi:N-acetylmuramoyl-L-alanine amidase
MFSFRTFLSVACLSLGACAPLPQQRASAPDWVAPRVAAEQRPSANFDERRPAYVVLHHTSDTSAEESLRTLTRGGSGVSSHYLIDRSGKVFYLVDERKRAWHAGESYWAGQRDLNSTSIGIELDNNGREPFGEPQIAALLSLLGEIQLRYRLPPSAFLAHGDVAPGRKVDPSAFFPWRRLAQSGFGVWCEPPYPSVPAGIDTALLLQTFGYSVWNLDAAAAAFKRRFVPEDPSPVVTEKDRSILYCLVQQGQTAAAQE